MVETLSSRLCDRLTAKGNFSQNEKDKIYYSINVIISTIFKLALVWTVFICFSDTVTFLYILLPIVALRSKIGGFHAETFSGCTLITLIFFVIVLVLNNTINLNYHGIILGHAASLILIMIFAPQVSPKRPQYSICEKKQFKHSGVAIVLISLLTFFIVGSSHYPHVIVWSIIILCVQLFMKGLFNNEIKKNH